MLIYLILPQPDSDDDFDEYNGDDYNNHYNHKDNH